jgi:hypothetical protein
MRHNSLDSINIKTRKGPNIKYPCVLTHKICRGIIKNIPLPPLYDFNADKKITVNKRLMMSGLILNRPEAANSATIAVRHDKKAYCFALNAGKKSTDAIRAIRISRNTIMPDMPAILYIG